jgi:hypothetical protein
MNMKKSLKVVFYVVLFVAMCISATSLVERRSHAEEEAPTCCAIGADCPGSTDLCCNAAGMGADPCMAGASGYCRKSCSGLIN